MPKLSSTSPRTTRPSYASCVVMSLNSLTALIRCAGGAVAMDVWATSLQSTSSPFITASDLTSCQTSARPFLRVHRRAILKDTHAAPPLCTRPSTSWSKRRSYHRTTRSLNWFLPMPPCDVALQISLCCRLIWSSDPEDSTFSSDPDMDLYTVENSHIYSKSYILRVIIIYYSLPSLLEK